MFRLVILKLLLVSSLWAAGSDFYDGLAGGELIGDLNAPDSFGEVSNSDLVEWSTQEYGDVASNAQGPIEAIDPQMRGLSWTRPEISPHGLKHAYNKHLGPTGKDKPPIFDFNDNTKEAKQATIDLVEGILNDPVAVQQGMGTNGNRYTGYLGEYDGHIIEVRIAEQASEPNKNGVSKVKPGDLSTVVRVSDNGLSNNWPNIKRVNGSLVSNIARNVDDLSPAPKVIDGSFKGGLSKRLVKGIQGGATVGAADLIPSRQVVQEIYDGRPVDAAKTQAVDIATGIPVGLAVGAGVTAAPVLAPVAAGAGLSMITIAAAEAGDEIVTQQTGEGALSKFRQTIGTRPRTGIASPGYEAPNPDAEPVTHEIKQASPESIAEAERRHNRSEWEKKLDCAKERFNPAKLEFGITELFRGCSDGNGLGIY